MKALVLLLISCLALHKAKGSTEAPRTAVYKFVRCNPEGGKANCVTKQTPEMPWSPELPERLPALTAQHLEAETVEDEKPAWDYEIDYNGEEETPVVSEEVESESPFLSEEGSGSYEGSTGEGSFLAVKDTNPDEGSGEYNVGVSNAMKRFLTAVKPKEQEMKEDHLLHL